MPALPESDALLLITWDDSPTDPRARPEVAGEVEGVAVIQGHAPEAAHYSFVLSSTCEPGQLTPFSCEADRGILCLFSVPVSPRTEVRTPSLCEEVRVTALGIGAKATGQETTQCEDIRCLCVCGTKRLLFFYYYYY